MGTANPASATPESTTNSGTTRAAERSAARSTGWSCSRRSELNRHTATSMPYVYTERVAQEPAAAGTLRPSAGDGGCRNGKEDCTGAGGAAGSPA
ncbi:hypothetical protein GCM10012285_27200 [Streptomyces kronopolitis]|uniref:Uncharacterized protein n=1 Tax=Streptomyces kronopolitis TaxID=1612435 RepID=A0ABQ2JEX4_9ACTN|nr:hypothetical protein GCM10012285_27200 [Streptomyces kronopolitis]